jgi:cell division protein FtsQ
VPKLAPLSQGGLALKRARSEKGLGFAAGMVLVAGLTAAAAAFGGGSMFDVSEGFGAMTDDLAVDAGFGVSEIRVAGVEGVRADEVRAVVMPDGRGSLLAANPAAVRERIEGLDWVASADVARRWPNQIRVTVERRDAFALWQHRGAVQVVDADGQAVHEARPADHLHLPHLVGEGAATTAGPVLRALEQLPATRARVQALVRVGDRRWDLRLKNGMAVRLPEADPIGALANLERWQTDVRLLDRPLARIDLRLDGPVVVTPRAPTPKPALPAEAV